jgi:acetyltransferase-like isoleucine patch superfamily enzyme
MSSSLKPLLVAPLRVMLRLTSGLRESWTRLRSHAALAAQLHQPLPSSVVVLGSIAVHGTANVLIGRDALLYPGLYLETQSPATITLGNSVVLSRGVHLVAMAGITLGDGCMVGEYASIRDANHVRVEGEPLRDSGHTAQPVVLGKQVWVGRGVTILGGVTIGDHATIGANAVVTHDVPANAVVGGVPARPLNQSRA